MSAFAILSLQSTLSLVVYALIGAWFVAPRLRDRSLHDALLPLVVVHAFRFAPMALLVPGQVDSAISHGAVSAIAYGDLLAGSLAIVAMICLRYRLQAAIAMTWIFNIVGAADVVNALIQGVSAELYAHPLGFGWYVLNFYVPMVIVTHAMMFMTLRRGSSAAARNDAT